MVWVGGGAVKVLDVRKSFEGTQPQPATKRRVNHLYVYMS